MSGLPAPICISPSGQIESLESLSWSSIARIFRRLDASVGEAFSMEIPERVDERPEHVVRFFGSERALGQKFSEIFLREFGDDVQEVHAGELATADS